MAYSLPACLRPASSTLDLVSPDRQFKIHTSGQFCRATQKSHSILEEFNRFPMGECENTPGLHCATEVCHHKAPQQHSLLVNPPVTARSSGKATKGTRSRAPGCSEPRGRGADLAMPQCQPRCHSRPRRMGPHAEFRCTATCKNLGHICAHTHTHTHRHTRTHKKKRSRHTT